MKEKFNPQLPIAVSDFYKPGGDRTPCIIPGPSKTRQEDAEDCDINVIMARYERTGELPHDGRQPLYYDFTTMPGSMMQSMEIMRLGEEAFMKLPAKVRREFDNDAAAFVQYASDPANNQQMQDWGLCDPLKAPSPPQPASPVAPAAPPAPGPGSVSPAPAGAPGASTQSSP